MKQNRSGLSVSLRLCAVLCACLVCALSAFPAARAQSAYPPIEVVEIQPLQPEGPPAFGQLYYVTEKGSVLLRTDMMLLTSGDVEADAELLPEGYELVGETSFPVQTERGEGMAVLRAVYGAEDHGTAGVARGTGRTAHRGGTAAGGEGRTFQSAERPERGSQLAAG